MASITLALVYYAFQSVRIILTMEVIQLGGRGIAFDGEDSFYHMAGIVIEPKRHNKDLTILRGCSNLRGRRTYYRKCTTDGAYIVTIHVWDLQTRICIIIIISQMQYSTNRIEFSSSPTKGCVFNHSLCKWTRIKVEEIDWILLCSFVAYGIKGRNFKSVWGIDLDRQSEGKLKLATDGRPSISSPFAKNRTEWASCHREKPNFVTNNKH
ncbi:hypothetical protein NPIL_635421 [Nephila pilipes]|uniref:Uncharacterized protein n=1 Tax=Nephila pilipes TaxID=299642 RepID=A0A8X6U7C8_NEPPI|nr:hypothetical protein NPIL_635421 [Nephila pilipes]